MGRDAIAILPAAPVRTRNNDVEYHYRPDSDFYYLTSFAEPEAVAVLIPGRAAGDIRALRTRSRPRAAKPGTVRGPAPRAP
jgi:Xaa-Pro aminopeptidase